MTNAWVSEWVFRNEATFLRRPRSVQCGSHFGVFDNLAFRVFRRQALVRCLTELPLEFSSPCRLPDPQRFNVLYLTQLTTLHVSVLKQPGLCVRAVQMQRPVVFFSPLCITRFERSILTQVIVIAFWSPDAFSLKPPQNLFRCPCAAIAPSHLLRCCSPLMH